MAALEWREKDARRARDSMNLLTALSSRTMMMLTPIIRHSREEELPVADVVTRNARVSAGMQ